MDDGWGGLTHVAANEDATEREPEWFQGPENDLIPEDALPFVRLKLVDDEAEDELESVRTGMPLLKYIDLVSLTCYTQSLLG